MEDLNNKNKFEEMNISAEWLKDCLEHIRTLKDLEKVCRDGIDEPMQPNDEVMLRFKFLRQMLSETKVLFRSVKKLLKEPDKTYKKIIGIQLILDVKSDTLIAKTFNQLKHTETLYLNSMYYNIVEDLSLIYESVIDELIDLGILFSKIKEKNEERKLR